MGCNCGGKAMRSSSAMTPRTHAPNVQRAQQSRAQPISHAPTQQVVQSARLQAQRAATQQATRRQV